MTLTKEYSLCSCAEIFLLLRMDYVPSIQRLANVTLYNFQFYYVAIFSPSHDFSSKTLITGGI